MTATDAIKKTMALCRQLTLDYVNDLKDADLLVRSVPGANHIAWQLGHLISSEREMMSALGHQMPDLPPGFAEAHTKETATSDDPAKFRRKDEYLELMEQMRAATLTALDATPEADFDKPAPESLRHFAPTVADLLTLVGVHQIMHAGQFVPIRRKLGKAAMF